MDILRNWFFFTFDKNLLNNGTFKINLASFSKANLTFSSRLYIRAILVRYL